MDEGRRDVEEGRNILGARLEFPAYKRAKILSLGLRPRDRDVSVAVAEDFGRVGEDGEGQNEENVKVHHGWANQTG